MTLKSSKQPDPISRTWNFKECEAYKKKFNKDLLLREQWRDPTKHYDGHLQIHSVTSKGNAR